MSSGRRVRAMVIAVAALLVCLFRAALVPAWANGDDDPHAILFSGRDLWLNGAFAHGGFLFAPSGLDQDGLLLKILFSGGLYRYDAKILGGESVIGAEGLAHILAGWRVKRGDAEFKFFFGPEFQRHHLEPDDPSNRLRGKSIGLRMAFQLCGTSRRPVPWSPPMPHCPRGLWLACVRRLARRHLPRPGPRMSEGYRHLRLGAHITAEDTEWSAAAGCAQDSQGRASPFLRLNMLTRL